MTQTQRRSRPNDRRNDELRRIQIIPGYLPYAEGSAFIALGDTHVICAATLEQRVPNFLLGSGRGWVTAEYGMLPRSSRERIPRERSGPGGRTAEIQRLIGRSLRAAVDLEALGERMIIIDCDVLRADGGTRTAAITGAFIALHDCLKWMEARSMIKVEKVLKDHIAAVSCGIFASQPVIDLDYLEDSAAETDANFVMTGSGGIVEIQGTAEGKPFSQEEFLTLLGLARNGIDELVALQKQAIG